MNVGIGPKITALTAGERATLDALCDCLFPPGAATPGAVTIGASGYIDQALAGPYAVFVSEYRAMLGSLDQAAGGSFVGATDKLAVVAALERDELPGLLRNPDRTTFDLVIRHLREGLFSDPIHGGNKDFAGWKAVGFPGAQFGFREGEQKLDYQVDRQPQSLTQVSQDARLPGLPRTIPSTAGIPANPDVLIVGGGAVGNFMALKFVRAGLQVVILEAGPPRTGRERSMDELLATAFRNEGGAAKFNDEVPTWRTRPGEKARRAVMSQGLETALGGNSIAWGAVAMRFYEDDFRIRSATAAKYGDHRIPEGSTLADWPMSYAELEPFYEEAEDLLGVSGHAGNRENPDRSRGNPFEAPRANPYKMPALRTSGLGQLFADSAKAQGYHPFPLPAAIATTAWNGRHACTYCSFCSRFGCHVDAKASAQNTVLPEALESGRLHIVSGARAMEIVTDESGRAVGVNYLGLDGETRFQAGGTVVVAAYAFENSRLLLLSRSRRHGRGVGNETDQVGRHYMTRQQPSVYAIFEGKRLNRFIGPTAQAMAIADLSGDHFDHSDVDFIRGGRIAAFNQYLPIEASGVLPPDVPRWGEAWRDFFLSSYNSTAMLFIDPEILPYENNRLDLDPDVKDKLGRPVIRITFDIGDNERKLMQYLQDRAEKIALGMGATRTWRRQFLTGPISTHDVGGTRMGNDPATSVTNGFGEVHDTPGLVVLGGSSFVSLPPVNPALTILALALRAADHIISQNTGAAA
ncbi:gluconate 2-dehydrogenase alpha chain [Xaviernesmea oryzae]|uniref:Gluconate 2-dehydrogenase alpha chain n=1 Tax=Xaviernesmea oryzae TaxID=464029 RepID=A0A1X7EJQ6_9HYPH|nr:GMC family oxidoreductase [Xaviernesmea oryzae]SMF34663.1 gluconate 2-dehydrogenase alpha chain [Xaviernesmea oryzae]